MACHRILFVISSLRKCGPVRQLGYIIKYLNRETFVPVIVKLTEEKEGSMDDYFRAMDVSVSTFFFPIRDIALKRKRSRKEILKFTHPDLVHVHGFRPDALFSGYEERPVVTTLRNFPGAEYRLRLGTFAGRIIEKAHTGFIKNITAPVACSPYVAAQYEKQYDLSVLGIDNGIDTKFYVSLSDEEKKALQKKLALDNSEMVFISSGDLSLRKDPETLIHAFLKSRWRDQGVLVFAGKEKIRGFKKKWAHPRIRFLGDVNDIRSWYQASDVLLSASRAEGLPNAVLEGMSCGLAPLLSDIMPHAYILDSYPAGETRFAIGDSSKLASLLNELTPEETNKKGQAASRHVNLHFSAQKMSQEYQDLYLRLISQKRENIL
jgi:glycosyltransferase involved in cell wall biosynthesis